MKAKIILVLFVGILIANYTNLRSQDTEPVHQPVNYCGNPNFFIFDTLPQFTQYQFIKGWMWDSRRSINKAFYSNQGDNWYPDSFSKIGDSANLCVRSNRYEPSLYCDHGGGTGVLMARAMVFNPALEIPDPITDYYAIANQCNQNNHSSVFGFKYIHPSADRTSSGLELYKSDFTQITKILQYPWDIDKLNFGDGEYNPADTAKDISGHIQLFNGNKYYLTVNLQRLNDVDTTNGSLPVISVKIFYLDPADNSTKAVKVRTLPTLPADSINTFYNEKRGLQAGQIPMTLPTDNIHIHKKDIPTDGTPITYSAYFTFFGAKTTPEIYLDNPRNPRDFNIEVTYFRNCDLKINAIKIESAHAKDLFAGKFDTIIIKNVEKSLNRFSCTDSQYNTEAASVQTKHTNYFREIISVETGVKCWAAERYFNKLAGNIGSGATGPEMPILYEAYVNPPDRWLEVSPARLYARVAAPYKPNFTDELDKDKVLGIVGGFKETRVNKGWGDTIIQLDTLNSGYETYFRYDQSRAEFNALSSQTDKINYICYNDAKGRAFSVQYYWEDRMKNAYYDKYCGGFQYSEKPWWSTNFPSCEFKTHSNDGHYQGVRNERLDHNQWLLDSTQLTDSARTEITRINRVINTKDSIAKQYQWWLFYRPLTAEELRLMDYSQILYGCRGITYDGAICNRRVFLDSNERKDTMNRTQLVFENNAFKNFETQFNASTFNRENFILDNAIGGDFIDNVCRYQPRLASTYYLKKDDNIPAKNDTCLKYFGCDTNRFYLGMKTNRWEIYKIHRWINDNEQTLLSLNLMASYGKGFLKQYSQHPSITSTNSIMDTYLLMDSIKTRKKWQADAFFGYTAVAPSHKEDSTEQFYDITLLKKDNYALSDMFYVGCQNRRTDPLVFKPIFWIMPGLPGSSNTTYKLCFYAGAELDLLTDDGGVDPYSLFANPPIYAKEHWQECYDKGLGFRILELPLRRLHKSFDERLFGFYVKELTYQYPAFGSTDFDSMKYWLKYEYDNKIDEIFVVNQYSLYGYENIEVPLQPGRGKILQVIPIYQPNNFEILSPKPFINPVVVDTCMYLRENVELIFKRADSSDANNCIYEIYCVNKSDTFNIYVPIIAEFKTYNNLDTTRDIPSSFQYFNYRNDSTFTSAWFPDTVMQDTTFLATYDAHCSNSRVSYKIGTRMCYIEAFLDLPCGICECSDSVKVNLAPINPMTMCRIIPLISQTKRLNSGDSCKYYGLAVTGGFSPNDTQLITGLSIAPDSVNPQPINFSTYNRWVDNPFMNIYCYPRCSYNLNFSFRNKSGDEVSNKVFSITIDNSQFPIDIDPTGILSDQCYSIQPEKRGVPSEDLHFEQEIIVDPNPTIGKANVKLNLENDLSGRLVLYTATGELIQEIHNGKLTKGSTDYQIDLSSQPSGVYIISIESDGMQYIKKFVKE